MRWEVWGVVWWEGAALACLLEVCTLACAAEATSYALSVLTLPSRPAQLAVSCSPRHLGQPGGRRAGCQRVQVHSRLQLGLAGWWGVCMHNPCASISCTAAHQVYLGMACPCCLNRSAAVHVQHAKTTGAGCSLAQVTSRGCAAAAAAGSMLFAAAVAASICWMARKQQHSTADTR